MIYSNINDIKKCLIKILSPDQRVTGTGFVVGEGYILTARHLITDLTQESQRSVVLADSPNNSYPVELVDSSDEMDIALLRFHLRDHAALPLANERGYQPGDRAWILGFQLASRMVDEPDLADAMIGSFDRDGMLVLSSALLPGMSGAPVFDLGCRKVVGVVSAQLTHDEDSTVTHTALAVPIEAIFGKFPWLREINDRATKHRQIDSFNLFKSDIALMLHDDFGAQVERDVAVSGIVIDLVARQTGIGRTLRTAIKCVPDILTYDQAVKFGASVVKLRSDNNVDNGLVVTNEVIPPDVLQGVADYPISCKTRSQLEDESLGISTYIDTVLDDYERSFDNVKGDKTPLIPEMSMYNVRQYYVDVNAVDEKEHHYRPIDTFITSWLTDDTSNVVSVLTDSGTMDSELEDHGQISILGDSGIGKTTFCLHLVYEVARLWRDKRVGRIPLYIPLRGYSPTRRLDDIISATIKAYRLRPGTSQVLLRHTVERGRFVLIFDGFDEMAATSSEDDVRKRFEEISKFAQRKGKVILTCRSNFFRFEADAQKTLMSSDVAQGLLRQSEQRKIHVLYIEPFEEPQILEYLSRHPGLAGHENEWWQNLQGASNLATISKRPIFLRMLVSTLPSLRYIHQGSTSVAELYVKFIDSVMEKDNLPEARRTIILKPEERTSFLRQLALDLMSNYRKTFRWDELLPLSRNRFSQLCQEKGRPDFVENDLRTIPLLQRRIDEFSFIHESFAEFLSALSIAEYLTKVHTDLEIELLQKVLTEGVRNFVVGIVGLMQHRKQFAYQHKEENIASGFTMLLVPPGPFLSGGYGTESSLVIKLLGRSVMIGKYPVTWREFETFRPNLRKKLGIISSDLAPATYISWQDMLQYCDWLSGRYGKRFRLPTEDEWEKAARGIDGRIYPWGDDVATPSKANYGEHAKDTVPVDSYPEGVSPYGLWDMCGNVSEITSTYLDQFVAHVCRGGSWEDPALMIQCTARRLAKFNVQSFDIGFRVAMDIDP